MSASCSPPRWTLPSADSSSGCFETMRAYAGKIFRLEAHLQRLSASANHLGVRLSMRPGPLGRRLTQAVARSGIREAIVRVALIPDAQRLATPSIVVQPVPLPPPSAYRRGIRLAVVPTKKFSVSQIDPQAKFSSRLGSIMAVMEAHLRGADEAIFLDATGSVTESTASNLGVIKAGRFLAPPCWLGLLAGITWHAVAEVARDEGMLIQEVPLTRHDLYNADEVFLSSTIKEVLAVTNVDGRMISDGHPGPYTRRLHRAFRRLVTRELRLHGRR